MKKTGIVIALVLCSVTAGAQSLAKAPSEREVQIARENAARDMRLADAMEKARLKEEAKPVAAYIPKEQKQEIREHKPEVFTAAMPGLKKKKAAKKKA
jgi:hypothetical protein